MISPTAIKNLVILATLVVLLLGSYYKGHHDASVAYELESKQAQLDVANKLEKVEALSTSIAQSLINNTTSTNTKLDTIILNAKGKKLTSVPCTPSLEFATTWNELNKATQ